jgi:hypothetical protein
MVLRLRHLLLALFTVLALILAPTAEPAAASIAFDGGTRDQRAQVTRALAASSFDWSILPQTITVHISPDVPSQAGSPRTGLESVGSVASFLLNHGVPILSL